MTTGPLTTGVRKHKRKVAATAASSQQGPPGEEGCRPSHPLQLRDRRLGQSSRLSPGPQLTAHTAASPAPVSPSASPAQPDTASPRAAATAMNQPCPGNPVLRAVCQRHGVPITPLIRAQDADGELMPMIAKVGGGQSPGTGEPALPVLMGGWGPGSEPTTASGRVARNPGSCSRADEEGHSRSCSHVQRRQTPAVTETVRLGGSWQKLRPHRQTAALRGHSGYSCPIAA